MSLFNQCTVGQKRNTPIYFSINYRTKIKLVPVIIDYCLLQFDGLKFFLGGRQHEGGESLLNFKFFNLNQQRFQQIR